MSFYHVDENEFESPTCRFFKEALYEMQILKGPGSRLIWPTTSFLKGSLLQNHDFDYVDEDEF